MGIFHDLRGNEKYGLAKTGLAKQNLVHYPA
jgi:hypothetical protein